MKKLQSRETLKRYFQKGKLPAAEDFEDVLDSTLNMVDEGFARTTENGVEVNLVKADQRRLLSFFGDSQKQNGPEWAVALEAENNNLDFVNVRDAQHGADVAHPDGATILSIATDGVQVNGTLRSTSRCGEPGSAAANGDWQVIKGPLEGCHAFEVIAGVGLPGKNTGRYALVHAFALNTFNPTGWFFNFLNLKKRIRCHNAWFLSRGDRLKLKWRAVEGKPRQYELCVKSVTSYGAGVQIQYRITDLWPTLGSATNRSAQEAPLGEW